MLRTALLALLLTAIWSCDRTPSPQPTPPAVQAPTPVLDAYRALWQGIDEDKAILTAFVVSASAKLDFPDPADAPKAEQLRAFLTEIQPSIERLLSLSRQTPEPFPPSFPDLDEAEEDAHLRHPTAWMQNLTRLAWADASRLWEAGEPDAAARRIAATLRIAHAMISQDDQHTQAAGGTILTVAARKTRNLLDAGLAERMSPATRQEVIEALQQFDPADPLRSLAVWERNARTAAAWARTEFSGRNAGRKLAAHIDTYGMNDVPLDIPGLDAESRAVLKMLEGTITIRKDPQPEADLSVRRIQQAIDDAEAMIGPIAEGLRSADPLGALTPWMEKARADPTQVCRIILGAPHASYITARRTGAELREAVRKLQP